MYDSLCTEFRRSIFNVFFPLKFGGGRTHLFQPGTVKSSMILTAVILVQSVPVALIRKRFVRSQHPDSD